MNEKLYIVLTVDWEKDHGKWIHSSRDVDYGGILTGTKCFEDILDDLHIPCTWLIETHKDYPELDIPKQFPEYIFELKNRANDEIGTHIHWGSYNHQKKCWEYPTHNTEWINDLIRYAKEEAAEFKINPISFRGGAFIYVPNLPTLLQRNGYLIDSTFEWQNSKNFPHPPRLEYAIKLMSTPTSPYFADPIDFKKIGSSNILEFPVYLHIPRILKRRLVTTTLLLRFRYLMHGFATLYMHIDEITDCKTGPNERTKVDTDIADKLRRFLEELVSSENVEFVTFSNALKLLKENKFGDDNSNRGEIMQ